MDTDELLAKAQPDSGTLDMIKAPSNKVQLDIEDAPFLIEPEDIPDDDEADASLPAFSADPLLERKKKKKRLLIIAGLSILLVLSVASWWVFRSMSPSIPPEPPEVIVVPSAPEPVNTAPQDHPVVFDPFWVEQKDAQGNTRFLTARFTLLSKDARLKEEALDKKLVLRDAFYYYLCNKPLEFFLDHENAPTIKNDLLSIANGYLSRGRLDDVLLESYLMR